MTDDPTRPDVYRLTYLAIKVILADTNPEDAQHREWLKEQLEIKTTAMTHMPPPSRNPPRGGRSPGA